MGCSEGQAARRCMLQRTRPLQAAPFYATRGYAYVMVWNDGPIEEVADRIFHRWAADAAAIADWPDPNHVPIRFYIVPLKKSWSSRVWATPEMPSVFTGWDCQHSVIPKILAL